MKREDLIHAIDTITPSNGLRAKVLALPGRSSRPRLENPLRHVLSLGAAGLMCAGIIVAVLALQNYASPSGNSTTPILNNTGLAAGPGTETTSPAESKAAPQPSTDPAPSEVPGLEPASPKLSPGQDIGADMAFLDYASDETVIFHGYFGLFVYDLDSKEVIRSLDLAPIGCAATQGDNYCAVSVSEDGNTVQLHPLSSKNAYIYTVSDNTLRDTVFESMESRFTGLVDPETDAGYQRVYQKFELCSYRAVRFGTGEYGYLHATEWIVGTLTYVRGDTVYELFRDMPTHPESLVPPTATARPTYPVQTPAPMPTPSSSQSSDLVKMTLPEVIISPDQAIYIAKKVYKDYFGLNVEDCLVIDVCSYSQNIVYGTGELWEPLCKTNAYAGKNIMVINFTGSVETGYEWYIELRDGAYGTIPEGTLVYDIIIDAASGKIVDRKAFDPQATRPPA